MLILRRRPGESVLIGEEIEIQVLEVGANRITLGIVAPRHIGILRKEVQLTRAANKAAAGSSVECVEALAARLQISPQGPALFTDMGK
jgi:carbon storage regulator